MENKKKILIFAVITIIIILLSTSFAFFIWNSSSDQNTNVSLNLSGLDAYIHYNKGTDVLTGTLLPSADYNGGIFTEIELWKDPSAASRTLYGHIYLDITTIGTNLANEPALKWAITSNGEVLNTGNFVGKSSGNSISLKLNIPLSTTKQLFKIYIWLDESMDINDAIVGETISTIVKAEATEVMVLEGAAAYINNIFVDANKSIVTNNSVNYQYAPSVGMMEDVGGNIRYYGADPNNYVSFNNELWRIIGVFKDIDDGTGNKKTRIKIARSGSIGNYAWNSNDINNWTSATIKTYLNETYTNGLNQMFKDMISNVKWNLGGWNTATLYADQFYKYERGSKVYSGSPTEWVGKIALMYPSDYMYSVDLARCNKDAYSFSTDTTNCRDTSWLKNTSSYQWTLTQDSGNSYRSFSIPAAGHIGNSRVTGSYAIRPVLYLNSTVQIIGGSGTSKDPYILK